MGMTERDREKGGKEEQREGRRERGEREREMNVCVCEIDRKRGEL